MLKLSVFAFLAIAIIGVSSVFVGRNENKVTGRNSRSGLELRLGANKCTWGPSYWCDSMSTSHECNASQHCVAKVWNNLSVPKDESHMCTECITVLDNLKQSLNSKTAEVVIREAISLLCYQAPISRKSCLQIIEPWIDDLDHSFANHIAPQVICKLIFFCNHKDDVENPFFVESQKASLALAPGPVITGDSPSVYGGSKIAPLTCSDGQVYWCKNMQNAKECNTVEHCKRVVWAHQPKNSPTPEISDVNDSTASPKSTIDTKEDILGFNKVALDSKECSQGQTFWCNNIVTAASCKAVGHCVQSVWSHMKVKQDTDDVCTICKDMVKQARDQLLSNETQNELKQVFEGSCHLIPVKTIEKGCDRLVDEFIPELVEVLSSQMNPDVVCSVAGLCNNVAVDLLLSAEATKAHSTSVTVKTENDDCPNCLNFANNLKTKFMQASKEDVIKVFQNSCSDLSALSSICIKIVNERADEIYSNLAIYFNAGLETDRHFPFSILNMCRENNMCNNKTKVCEETPAEHNTGISVEVNHNSQSGIVARGNGCKDLPCDLCKQLMHHLKDILIANSTKTEFKEVLEGICKQTGAYKDECLTLVNTYYEAIYNFLAQESDSMIFCKEAGLCPKNNVVMFNTVDLAPIVPMPIEPVDKSPNYGDHLTGSEEKTDSSDSKLTPLSPEVMAESSNSPTCMMCEYVLHFIQQQVSDTKNEQKILNAMKQACDQMPGEFAKECDSFVSEYGSAFVALFVQQIDPSQVCPKLKVCSKQSTKPLLGADEGKGACPLCLLAMQAVEQQIFNNRTEEEVKDSLDSICSTLPKGLNSECQGFINKHYDELVDMLIAETTPQEICVYLRVCAPPKRTIIEESQHPTKEDELDFIPPMDVGVNVNLVDDSEQCILCEFVMGNLAKIMKDRKTEEEIKHAVHGICVIMPKSVKQECYDFVNEYADLIIQLLAQNIQPKEICKELRCCKAATSAVKVKIEDCALCKDIMSHLDDALADDEVIDGKINVLDKVCYHVDKTEFDQCNKFILEHGTDILVLLPTTQSYLICEKIKVCTAGGCEFTMMSHHSSNSILSWTRDNVTSTTNISLLVCLLMIVSVVLLMVYRRKRYQRRMLIGDVTPYEKLYQPTTYSSDHDYMTAVIS